MKEQANDSMRDKRISSENKQSLTTFKPSNPSQPSDNPAKNLNEPRGVQAAEKNSVGSGGSSLQKQLLFSNNCGSEPLSSGNKKKLDIQMIQG